MTRLLRSFRCAIGLFFLGSVSTHAAAQFQNISPATNILERLGGQLLSAPGAPTPEPGDQVAAFFDDQILGSFTFVSTQSDPLAWEMIIFGDNPDTPNTIEGPAAAANGVPGDRITFRFFDAGTNTIRTDVAPVNAQGEVITVTFQGALTIQLPIDIPGAPPLPGIPGPDPPFDLTLGIAAPNPVPSTPNGPSGASRDVNGDGRINKRDAAIVMRILVGARRGVSEADAMRADVNGDGVVNTRDVVAILTDTSSFPNQP